MEFGIVLRPGPRECTRCLRTVRRPSRQRVCIHCYDFFCIGCSVSTEQYDFMCIPCDLMTARVFHRANLDSIPDNVLINFMRMKGVECDERMTRDELLEIFENSFYLRANGCVAATSTATEFRSVVRAPGVEISDSDTDEEPVRTYENEVHYEPERDYEAEEEAGEAEIEDQGAIEPQIEAMVEEQPSTSAGSQAAGSAPVAAIATAEEQEEDLDVATGWDNERYTSESSDEEAACSLVRLQSKYRVFNVYEPDDGESYSSSDELDSYYTPRNDSSSGASGMMAEGWNRRLGESDNSSNQPARPLQPVRPMQTIVPIQLVQPIQIARPTRSASVPELNANRALAPAPQRVRARPARGGCIVCGGTLRGREYLRCRHGVTCDPCSRRVLCCPVIRHKVINLASPGLL